MWVLCSEFCVVCTTLDSYLEMSLPASEHFLLETALRVVEKSSGDVWIRLDGGIYSMYAPTWACHGSDGVWLAHAREIGMLPAVHRP